MGLVLGGGGLTGAAYHLGTLFALRMATGWNPDEAEVIVGTSSGAFVTALVRGNAVTLDTLVGNAHSRTEVAEALGNMIYQRTRPTGLARWVGRGILPGLRRPSLDLALGSPAFYSTGGVVAWLNEELGDVAAGWPQRSTVIVGYDLERRHRVLFGTEAAPDVSLSEAVGVSLAVPFLFEPVEIGDRWYADGGIASGTSADAVLASPAPLDVLIVVAPMAAMGKRTGARLYEGVFDRFGRAALDAELEEVEAAWPCTDIVVLRPDPEVLALARPNPMSVKAAVPVFLRTLRSMRDELGRPDVWSVLERHLVRDEMVASSRSTVPSAVDIA